MRHQYLVSIRRVPGYREKTPLGRSLRLFSSLTSLRRAEFREQNRFFDYPRGCAESPDRDIDRSFFLGSPSEQS